jgi:hypothetical protein
LLEPRLLLLLKTDAETAGPNPGRLSRKDLDKGLRNKATFGPIPDSRFPIPDSRFPFPGPNPAPILLFLNILPPPL